MDVISCTKCGKCSFECKSACIDIKNLNVDFSRCVACYNCISTCPSNSLAYEFAWGDKSKTIQTDKFKRDFITKCLLYFVVFTGMTNKARTESTKIEDAGLIPIKKKFPVSPPGSISIKHFNSRCTGCHLCVSACPTKVLQPSFLEYGFTGMMQPHMDYATEFCDYGCTICSQVCPTGAILSLTLDDKKLTQIGIVNFVIEKCVVYTENTACGSCSEHCPTQAVRMIPYKSNLTIPETHPDICIGCGACEYACPVRPHRAIYVDGNAIHQVAKTPHFDEMKVETQEEFPF
jgi:ferredoxin